MKLVLGILIFIGIAILYPLLIGLLYFVVVAGPIWLFSILLILCYTHTLLPMMKSLSEIPVVGKPVAFLTAFVIVFTISAVCLFLVSLPYTIMTVEFFTGYDMGWDSFPTIGFYKTILGPLGRCIKIATPGDPIFEKVGLPIYFGQIIFEAPLLMGTVLMSFWLPIKSFLWTFFAWAEI